MKKISNLKLTSLYEKELSQQELSALRGGGCLWCSCGCKYAGDKDGPYDSYYGGSSSGSNDSANDGGWF